MNEFKLRRHGIINQNTFRCSGGADVTAQKEEEIVNFIISLHLRQKIQSRQRTINIHNHLTFFNCTRIDKQQ